MKAQAKLVVEHPVMVVIVRLSTVLVRVTVCVTVPALKVRSVVGIAEVTVSVL